MLVGIAVAGALAFAHALGFGGPGRIFFPADNQIPFIDDDDDGASALVGVSGDRGVELADAFGGVDDEQGNISAFQVLACHHDGKFLGHEARLAFAADAGGVDEAEGAAVVLDDFDAGAAAGAGGGGDDGAVGRSQAVEQRGLADVGVADDGDFYFVGWKIVVGPFALLRAG